MQQYEIEKRIWAYLDGLDSPEERQETETLIAGNEVWKETCQKLQALQSMLGDKDLLEQPSMRFTKNIMDELASVEPAHKMQPLAKSWVVKLLGAFFILSTVALIILSVTTESSGKYKIPDWGMLNNHQHHQILFCAAAINILVLLVLADKYRSFRRQIHKTNPSV